MEVPPQLLDTWLPPSPPAPITKNSPLSGGRPPTPSPAGHHFLAQSPVYFRCSSCHMLTIILSVSSLRFLHWMSVLRVGIWSSLLCPQRGAQCLVCADWTCYILWWSVWGRRDWDPPQLRVQTGVTGPLSIRVQAEPLMLFYCVFPLPTSALSPGHKCNFIEFCHVITWAGCGLLLLPAFLLAFGHFWPYNFFQSDFTDGAILGTYVTVLIGNSLFTSTVKYPVRCFLGVWVLPFVNWHWHVLCVGFLYLHMFQP